jgi:hypothetical protein
VTAPAAAATPGRLRTSRLVASIPSRVPALACLAWRVPILGTAARHDVCLSRRRPRRPGQPDMHSRTPAASPMASIVSGRAISGGELLSSVVRVVGP